jgi:hypothetical protein
MRSLLSVRAANGKPLRILAIVFLLASGLARPSAAKVTIDFDPSLDFSRYKSFAFIGGVPNLVMLQLDPDFMYTRIHHNVAQELEKKGVREVVAGQNPDLVVRYWVTPSADVDAAAMGNWAPYSPYITGSWAGTYNTSAITSKKTNTLVIDLIDTKSKSLAWRLYLTRQLSDPDRDWKKVDEEMAAGFKSYPPSDKDKAEKHQSQKPAGT